MCAHTGEFIMAAALSPVTSASVGRAGGLVCWYIRNSRDACVVVHVCLRAAPSERVGKGWGREKGRKHNPCDKMDRCICENALH